MYFENDVQKYFSWTSTWQCFLECIIGALWTLAIVNRNGLGIHGMGCTITNTNTNIQKNLKFGRSLHLLGREVSLLVRPDTTLIKKGSVFAKKAGLHIC